MIEKTLEELQAETKQKKKLLFGEEMFDIKPSYEKGFREVIDNEIATLHMSITMIKRAVYSHIRHFLEKRDLFTADYINALNESFLSEAVKHDESFFIQKYIDDFLEDFEAEIDWYMANTEANTVNCLLRHKEAS